MSDIKLTFLGHVSFLLKGPDCQIVIDPNFSEKIGVLKRKLPAEFDPLLLHETNAILYTNAHHHRLDLASLKFFKQKSQVMLPMGLESLIETYFQFHLNELKDGAQTQLGSLKIKAIKALHRGFRKSGVRFGLALNYIIKTPELTLFYCSDTRYDGKYFHEIGQEYNIDVAILPIDHAGPDAIAGKRFMTAAQALQAFKDLGAKTLVPCCYGSFNFSGRKDDDYLAEFKKMVEEQGLNHQVQFLKPGESLDDGRKSHVSLVS